MWINPELVQAAISAWNEATNDPQRANRERFEKVYCGVQRVGFWVQALGFRVSIS